ncbi:hypothetical protein E2R51_02245 [Jeotgalibacillus sp. S-D1]|uniref:hypothetical protein n=1 Tax=Jeotgalibacillus sp. S-D1 TaxID=2552189 RepID=UPI00105A6995|nr:hypothetical protein [Jeotgalibacillus sp. S-D1]TDL34557.1 hypothetical protein E2R51_02245 [Jeotgalibacillus sp. S-D1]
MKKDFFFCYNGTLANFLRNSGMQHITVAQDPITKKVFSLFEINDELQMKIKGYKSLQNGTKHT